MTRFNQVLTYVGIVLFVLFLGWTIPYMAVVPAVRLYQIGHMMVTGKAPLLGADLTLLVPPTLAVWYLGTRPALRRIAAHVPVLWPAVTLAYAMTVGTTLAAHLLYRGLVFAPQWRWGVYAGALLIVVAMRVLISWVFDRFFQEGSV